MSLLAAYSTPWKGLNTSVPSNHIEAGECAAMQNFVFYEGQLQQVTYKQFGLDDTPDGTPIKAIFSFVDPNNNPQQGVITEENLYAPVTSASYGTAYPLAAPSAEAVNYQVFSNRLFFVNGSQYVQYFDGSALVTATNLYGARYIFELGSSICIANTVEAGGDFVQRVRWAVAGTFNEWDPGTYIGAGFEDLLECPDGITGVLSTNPVAYLIRDNGITQMIPTGIGTSPFDFNHLWASERGIGNVLDETAANFGPVGFVVAADDIYTITASSYEKVGTKVKNILYKQLLNSTFRVAWVESLISRGIPYFRYRLALVLPTLYDPNGPCVIWSFNTEIGGWEYEYISYGGTPKSITGKPGYTDVLPEFTILRTSPTIPIYDGTGNKMFQYETPSTGHIYCPTSITFKREYDPKGRNITVRQVYVRYQYLGNTAAQAMPVTVTVDGMNGSNTATLNLADPTATKANLGGVLPPKTTGKYYGAFFSVPLTDLEFQVTISMHKPLSGLNSIKISDVMVFGDLDEQNIR